MKRILIFSCAIFCTLPLLSQFRMGVHGSTAYVSALEFGIGGRVVTPITNQFLAQGTVSIYPRTSTVFIDLEGRYDLPSSTLNIDPLFGISLISSNDFRGLGTGFNLGATFTTALQQKTNIYLEPKIQFGSFKTALIISCGVLF